MTAWLLLYHTWVGRGGNTKKRGARGSCILIVISLAAKINSSYREVSFRDLDSKEMDPEGWNRK
jgi:hypothetical protein